MGARRGQTDFKTPTTRRNDGNERVEGVARSELETIQDTALLEAWRVQQVQVDKDARECATAWRRARVLNDMTEGKSPKVTVTELFFDTLSCKLQLVELKAFKKKVSKLVGKSGINQVSIEDITDDLVETAAAVVKDKTSRKLDFSDARTRSDEKKANPQPVFEALVTQVSEGLLPVDSAIAQLAKVGVNVTKKAMKDAASAFKLTGEVIKVSECTDARGRKRLVSAAAEGQMYLVFNHYVKLGYALSSSFVVDVAKEYFKDERGREPCEKELSSAWAYRFMKRCGFQSKEQHAVDHLRKNSASEFNIANFFDRVKEIAVKLCFAEACLNFNDNEKMSVVLRWREEMRHRVWTCDEMKLELGQEKNVKGIRMMRASDSRRGACGKVAVTHDKSFCCSMMGARNLAGEALAPYIVTNRDPQDVPEMLGYITDPATGEAQRAQIMRGNAKASFDGRAFAEWLVNHLAPMIPNLSPENPALLILDGASTHQSAHIINICKTLGVKLTFLPPNCTHVLQGEDVYNFGLFKVKYRKEKAASEGAKRIAADWFISKFELNTNLALPLGQQDLWHAVHVGYQYAFSRKAVMKGFEMQGLQPFNRRPLWEMYPHRTPRVRNDGDEDQELRAQATTTRISIPGAPGALAMGDALDLGANETQFKQNGSAKCYLRQMCVVHSATELSNKLRRGEELTTKDKNFLSTYIDARSQEQVNNVVAGSTVQKRTRLALDKVPEATEAYDALCAQRDERVAQRRVATMTAKKAAEMHARAVAGVPEPTNQLYTSNDEAKATLKDLKDTLARENDLGGQLTRGDMIDVMRAHRAPMPQNPSKALLLPLIQNIEPEIFAAHNKAVDDGKPTRKRARALAASNAAIEAAQAHANDENNEQIGTGERSSNRLNKKKRLSTRAPLSDCSNVPSLATKVKNIFRALLF